MAPWFILALFGMLVGLVAVIGGLWALLKEKVVVDQKGNVTEIEVPFFGKVKTNYPSLAATFLGIVLVAFIVSKVTVTRDEIPLVAALSFENNAGSPDLFVGAIPNEYIRFGSALRGGNNQFEIQVDKNGEYSVVAFTLVGIDEGRPVYDLVQGPAVLDPAQDSMTFSGMFGNAAGLQR